MKRKTTAIISFVTTTLVVLGAASLNAEGPRDGTHKAALDIVAKHFEPKVADTKKPIEGIDLGKGVFARMTPVDQKGVYAMDVTLTRAPEAKGVITTRLDVSCAVDTFSPMSRVPAPVTVDIGRKKVVASLAPGQTITKRVTFKPKQLNGPTAGTARVTVSMGKVVVHNGLFLALDGAAPVGNQPVNQLGMLF